MPQARGPEPEALSAELRGLCGFRVGSTQHASAWHLGMLPLIITVLDRDDGTPDENPY